CLSRNDPLWSICEQRDRLEIFDYVVLETITRAVENMRLPMADADGVTIGRCTRDTAHADAPARAGHILDNYRLTGRSPPMLCENTSECVRGPARRERHDNGDGARWIDLRARGQRPRGRRAASSVMNWRRLRSSMGSSPEPTVPAYSRLRMHRKLPA